MPERVDQREVLVRYLLGVASVVEREAVEEECFAGSSGLDLLVGVEDELIDDYVRGALTKADRLLFERNFLCTAGRRRRLELTKSLVEALAGSGSGDLSAAYQETLGQSPITAQLTEGASRQIETSPRQLALQDRSEVFANLLAWLDPVREKAAEKYETIRSGLIRMFAMRGHADAEDLADQTIDRVSLRFNQVKQTYVGDPAKYFYAIARHLLLESARSASAPILPDVVSENIEVASANAERIHSCHQKCLDELSLSDHQLIQQYYGLEKVAKIANRKELAENLGVPLNTLRIRAHRIRTRLRKCVSSCLEETNDLP